MEIQDVSSLKKVSMQDDDSYEQSQPWNSQFLIFLGNAVAYCGKVQNIEKCYCRVNHETVADPAKNPKCSVFGDMFTKGPGHW